MTTPLAVRLTIGSTDLMQAAKFVKELSAMRSDPSRNSVVESALVIATIVSYGRPFTKSFSDGKAAPKVDAEELGVFTAHPELRAVHERILDLRNRAAAHADWEYHQTFEHPDGRHVLAYDFSKELADTGTIVKLIAVMGVNFISRQYALDGKADPWATT